MIKTILNFNHFVKTTRFSIEIITNCNLTIQYAGLVASVSSPRNCDSAFKKVLERPENESFRVLLAVGYPLERCMVPDSRRKPFEQLCEEI